MAAAPSSSSSSVVVRWSLISAARSLSLSAKRPLGNTPSALRLCGHARHFATRPRTDDPAGTTAACNHAITPCTCTPHAAEAPAACLLIARSLATDQTQGRAAPPPPLVPERWSANKAEGHPAHLIHGATLFPIDSLSHLLPHRHSHSAVETDRETQRQRRTEGSEDLM